jgi:hypothetical protein
MVAVRDEIILDPRNCAKGSIWALKFSARRCIGATYHAPRQWTSTEGAPRFLAGECETDKVDRCRGRKLVDPGAVTWQPGG